MEESVLELNLSLWSVAREVWREVWREGGGNSEDPAAGALTPTNIRPGVNVLPKKGLHTCLFFHLWSVYSTRKIVIPVSRRDCVNKR